MLRVTDITQTRVFQEALQQGREEGIEKGIEKERGKSPWRGDFSRWADPSRKSCRQRS